MTKAQKAEIKEIIKRVEVLQEEFQSEFDELSEKAQAGDRGDALLEQVDGCASVIASLDCLLE